MKKFIFVFALLSLTAATASSQMIRLGVKGGLTMLSTDIDDVTNSSGSQWTEFKSKNMGWNLGLMARVNIPLTGLYVQPELIYNHAAYRMFDTSGKSSKIKYANIELPVLLGFKILFLRANVGPTFTLATIDDGDLFKVERPDVGFQAGLGVTVKKFAIDVRYHGYFNKAWNDIKISDVGNKIKANDGYWGVSLGYFF